MIIDERPDCTRLKRPVAKYGWLAIVLLISAVAFAVYTVTALPDMPGPPWSLQRRLFEKLAGLVFVGLVSFAVGNSRRAWSNKRIEIRPTEGTINVIEAGSGPSKIIPFSKIKDAEIVVTSIASSPRPVNLYILQLNYHDSTHDFLCSDLRVQVMTHIRDLIRIR